MIISFLVGLIIGFSSVLLFRKLQSILSPSISIWHKIRTVSNTTPKLKIEVRSISKRIVQWKYTNDESGVLVEKSFIFIARWPHTMDDEASRLNNIIDKKVAELESTYPKRDTIN